MCCMWSARCWRSSPPSPSPIAAWSRCAVRPATSMAMCCSCLPCASWCRAGLRPTGQGLDVTDALNPRTRMLLEAPIAPTLLRLAAPNVLVMLAQAGVGLIETYFVGKLGTDALAGMALVFPVVMLMQMTSAGAMGGGIASAIARALGARRRDDADALVLHSLVIAAVFSLIFTVGVVGGGRWLYTRMGGTGGALAAALVYSNWVFAGAFLVWLFNTLSAAIAGYGTASRLEYLLVPLVFGLGAPLVAMVGTCIGAGQRERALRATWIGAAMAFVMAEAIGLWAAAFPHTWLSLFNSAPAMLEAGALYLRTVGPVYGFFGLGLVLYFASQGAGRLLVPVIGNITRLAVAVTGGGLALRGGGGLAAVFPAQAVALVLYGVVNAWAIAGGAWFGPVGWPRSMAGLLRRMPQA